MKPDNKNFKGKMKEQVSGRSLLSTLMNEVKAIRGSKTKHTVPTLNLIDMDICTIELAVNLPEYKNYVESMIQSYNRYLGYASNVTFDSVKHVFKHGLDLYCMMESIFRYYQSNEMKLPTGEELNGIFDICTSTMIISGDVDTMHTSRIDSSLKGISNKVWESDFISKVENVLLPQQIITEYNYYLGQLFDVSDSNSKEKLSFVRIWPSIEDSSFITVPKSDGTMPKLTKTAFDNTYTLLNTYLTPQVRDFICNFLGWIKPNQDWTRPITADVVYTIRDEKFISTFNTLYPEKVETIIHYQDGSDKCTPKDLINSWARYYYDFEIICDGSEKSESKASLYYFGIDNVNAEQYILMQNEMLNDIKLDFNNYLLLCMLATEEIAGSKGKYVGGMYSMITSVNCYDGSYLNNPDLQQIYMGNDLKFAMYSDTYDPANDAPCHVVASDYTGLVGDSLEATEYSENLAIFNYPVVIPERWKVLWTYNDATDLFVEDVNIAALYADVIVNGGFDGDWDPASNVFTVNYDYKINHGNDKIAFDTYTMDPNEVHLALVTVMFGMLTGFSSYNESIRYIDDLFRGKQQETL